MRIQDLQSDYDTFKKGKAREITDLKKDSQRQESKMRRLAMLNQKQKSVLQACPFRACWYSYGALHVNVPLRTCQRTTSFPFTEFVSHADMQHAQ